MTEKERIADPASSFDNGYHLFAKEQHRKRIRKTPERINYAIQQFKQNKIEYSLKNKETGHFHCRRKSDNKLFEFYAGTGKIKGYEHRGIHFLINILNK